MSSEQQNDRFMSILDEIGKIVAASFDEPEYPNEAPFSPDTAYPEYAKISGKLCNDRNCAYRAVRNALRLLGLDFDRYNTNLWNPLRDIVKPGNTVVVKPNFVRDFRESDRFHADCLIANGSIIRAVIDYIFIALKGDGRIIVADSPQNDADFSEILKITQIEAIAEFYRNEVMFNIEIYDLRPEMAKKVKGVIVGHETLKGDPKGYVEVNLKKHSKFYEIEELCDNLYGSEYDRQELVSHHTGGNHSYLISKTILEADCVVSIPKLKTHKKAGITVNLKNLVGINGNKNWLPHHREGTPSEGGDQYLEDTNLRRFERKMTELFKMIFPVFGKLRLILAGPIKTIGNKVFGDTNIDTIRSGNWYGNDTTWRMVIDLNRILYYADKHGKLHNKPVRSFFGFVDGFISGEGNGPLDPTPKKTGVVIAGINPVAIDLVAAKLMGFDYKKIPLLYESLKKHPLSIANFDYIDIISRSNKLEINNRLFEIRKNIFNFVPHFGWIGHIEKVE